jgi:putative nucleotidyltransferase with HDIG domain
MTTTLEISVAGARELARTVIGDLPDRWRHTAAVAARAEELAASVDDRDVQVLVMAAWLHDIGYGELARVTGFHPLDGARLLDALRWPARVNALVAHHSGARFVAAVRGFGAALGDYPDEGSTVSDALAYADQTVGACGQRLSLEDRMADMLRRHGPDSPNARAHHLRGPYLTAVGRRVDARLRALAVSC